MKPPAGARAGAGAGEATGGGAGAAGTAAAPHRELLGVGRLVAEPNRHEAEFAVLIVDDGQGKGIGSQLTDACLAIAAEWGVERVVAETAQSNLRMRAIFERPSFSAELDSAGETVLTRKRMTAAAGADAN